MPSPNIQSIQPLPLHKLLLTFANGEVRVFDCTPYLDKGVFKELKNESAFATARVVAGSVEWDGGIDLSYDTLYRESIANTLVGSEQAMD